MTQGEQEQRRAKLKILEIKFRKSRETLLAMTGPKAVKRSAPEAFAEDLTRKVPPMQQAFASTAPPADLRMALGLARSNLLNARMASLTSDPHSDLLRNPLLLGATRYDAQLSSLLGRRTGAPQLAPSILADGLSESFLLQADRVPSTATSTPELLRRSLYQNSNSSFRAGLLSSRAAALTNLERSIAAMGGPLRMPSVLPTALDAVEAEQASQLAKRARTSY